MTSIEAAALAITAGGRSGRFATGMVLNADQIEPRFVGHPSLFDELG